MDAICPSVIDPLVRIWTTLHKDLKLEVEAAELRYLRRVVFEMDDELVARLLAAKLAMAKQPSDARPSDDLARRGSEILYAVQGRRRRVRLVHGSIDEDGFLGVRTRFGAALLGLRSGQSLLWPLEQGRLVEVHALSVTASPKRNAGPGQAGSGQARARCVFG